MFDEGLFIQCPFTASQNIICCQYRWGIVKKNNATIASTWIELEGIVSYFRKAQTKQPPCRDILSVDTELDYLGSRPSLFFVSVEEDVSLPWSSDIWALNEDPVSPFDCCICETEFPIKYLEWL